MTAPHAHAGNNAAFTGPPDPDCFICRSGGKRTTGEIVAELRSGNIRRIADAAREAADRLAELDADNRRLINRCAELEVIAVRDRIRANERING